MNPSLEQRFDARRPDIRDLCRTIQSLGSLDEVEAFLSDVCTHQELRMLSERWSIAKLMHMGFPYRVISSKTGASSATIARVSQSFARGTGELLRVCKRRQETIAQQCESRA